MCIVDPGSEFDVQLVEAILLLDSWAFACTEKARLSKHVSGLIKHVISRPWQLGKPSGKDWDSVSLTERQRQSHDI